MTTDRMHVTRGGAMCRVAKPAWSNPLDTTHSKARGGRWNAPGAFDVLYLNATVDVARAQVRWMYAGLPYGPEDLDPAEAAVLVTVEVPNDEFLDAVTLEGLKALGLPATYPLADDGDPVPWPACQVIGQSAYDDGEAGVACLSAATHADGEELALFTPNATTSARMTRIHAFNDWYWN